MEEKPKNLWKTFVDYNKYQYYVKISTTESEDVDERVVYMEDLEKRKQVYGICGECKEPGTGENWCQPCNAKRLKDDFENWTSGNEIIDEFIQQSQLNAVHYLNYIEWIPFEKFQNITYIAEGGFGKIYSAEWPEGYIYNWDIENQEWHRVHREKYVLKSLKNSSNNISSDFLNEIKSYLHIYLVDIIQCYGITQDSITKEYMMVLYYCGDGNLRNYLNESVVYLDYESKINNLRDIARGLFDIHNAGKVHKDFHSGNILFYDKWNDEIENSKDSKDSEDDEDIENVRDNENNEDCENNKNTKDNENSQKSEIYFQIKECDKIGEKKFKTRSNFENKSKSIQTHPQAIYTSRLINFKNLPKPVNSTDLSAIQINSGVNYNIQSASANLLISECLDVQLSELELNEICQDEESNANNE
ncbi:kinase-like domain-containing protein [Rhizophagus clarus]|uniref:Kinase-like domain-containing protein n=1 Tax=Rhizophagus clarus TaxID=94130 RepID=A0A8H3LL00_9GLOM|nr:kinase-like domain-containing protein [Rhizophagus clarus]